MVFPGRVSLGDLGWLYPSPGEKQHLRIWSGKRVLVSCCLVQVVCFVLVMAGALPLTPMISGEGQMSIWCSSASFLTFFVVFLFSSDAWIYAFQHLSLRVVYGNSKL